MGLGAGPGSPLAWSTSVPSLKGSRRLPSGAASLRQLCRWCPRCPPPVNIHNVFRIFFGQDVISTRDLPNLQRQNCLWVLSNCQKIGLDFHFRFVSLCMEISRRQPALISRCSRGTTRLPCGTRRVSRVEIALLHCSTRQVRYSMGDVTPFLGQDGNTTGRGLPKVAD